MTSVFSPGATTQKPSKPSPLAQTSFPPPTPLGPATSPSHRPDFSSSSPPIPAVPTKSHHRRTYARSNRARGNLGRGRGGIRNPYPYRETPPADEIEGDPGKMIEAALQVQLQPSPTLGTFAGPSNGARVKKKTPPPLIRIAIQNSFTSKTSSGETLPLIPIPGRTRLTALSASTSTVTSTSIRGPSPSPSSSSIPVRAARRIYLQQPRPRRKPTQTNGEPQRRRYGADSTSVSVDPRTTSDGTSTSTSTSIPTSKREPSAILADARRNADHILRPTQSRKGNTGGDDFWPNERGARNDHAAFSTSTGVVGTGLGTSSCPPTEYDESSGSYTRSPIRGTSDESFSPTRKIMRLLKQAGGSSSSVAHGTFRANRRSRDGSPLTDREKENMIEEDPQDGRYARITSCPAGSSKGSEDDDVLENNQDRSKAGWRTISELTSDLYSSCTDRLIFPCGEKEAGEPKVVWFERSNEGDGDWEVIDHEMEEMLDEMIEDEDMQGEQMGDEVEGGIGLSPGLEMEVDFSVAWPADDETSDRDHLEVPTTVPMAESNGNSSEVDYGWRNSDTKVEKDFPLAWPGEEDMSDQDREDVLAETRPAKNDHNPRDMEIDRGRSYTEEMEEHDDTPDTLKIASQSLEIDGYWKRVKSIWVMVPRGRSAESERPIRSPWTVRKKRDTHDIPEAHAQTLFSDGYWRRVEDKWVMVPKPRPGGTDGLRLPVPVPRLEEVEEA